MFNLIAKAHPLGATVYDMDLSKSLSNESFSQILQALGQYGVLCFPNQQIDAKNLRDFSAHFGSLQVGVSNAFEPGYPEVSVLSNILVNGELIGLPDAGQDWHTDMSYNSTIGFLNVLYAIKIPTRDGRPIGDTLFANMHAAFDDLPDHMKMDLDGLSVTHDFNKFWETMVRRPGSNRKPLSPEQRAKRPPAVHPLFLKHPITGRKVLYCNPGYAVRINEVSADESDQLLDFLFEHQLQSKFQYRHSWNEGDVLVWDHIGTLHYALPDYEMHEHRLIKRCQVMADKIFDPDFATQGISLV